ncbi:MAG: hypothetical protein HYI21_09300 [Sediminibacterium sp. Gen4]|jgi:hypothetical protein|uniref:hypothetical protein n=1 Tax=unclassified Sediminibacterium TaxID=2635961 RepID=UPI0015BB9E03|nr:MULTISPECIES: hypothetical protein [unclassified Sediminibacterium]MBW0160308.1 hypothetical protein [Sediminibacterium sp.]MBW0163313.1 hypothetical protein [Sediminibacterium sp.]NWK66210.1 hypothetical protein [Sediminibacterium sp. Gen4]
MLTPGHTSSQSLTNCSKKVTDMILYVVSKEMAQQMLSTTSEVDRNYYLEISQHKKVRTKRNRKMSIF